MTTLALFDKMLHDFHRDFPRRAVRELHWCENEERALRDVCKPSTAAERRLRIYNGSGVMHAYGGLDYFMDVVRTPDRCYTLLI